MLGLKAYFLIELFISIVFGVLIAVLVICLIDCGLLIRLGRVELKVFGLTNPPISAPA